MAKPNEYRHIRAWGNLLGSFEYYIRDQQALAAAENAPIDAIYKGRDEHGEKDRWHTFGEVENRENRDLVSSFLLFDKAS